MPLDAVLEQVRGDLGVGLGEQVVAVALELVAQLGEVLDDPVVHHRDAALLAEVRVRVGVVGGAVGGPAGVPDAGRRRRQRLSPRSPSRGWPSLPARLSETIVPPSTRAMPAES